MPAPTKKIIATSLLELLKEKRIDKITISDITSNCDITRVTFYNHFYDKRDLLNWMYKEFADDSLKESKEGESLHDSIVKLFHFFYDNKLFYRSVIKQESSSDIPSYFYSYSVEFYKDLLEKKCGSDVLTDEIIFSIKFNSQGAARMTIEWIKDGMKESPDLMARMIFDNIPEMLKKLADS